MTWRIRLLIASILACSSVPSLHAQSSGKATLEMDAEGEVQIAPDGHVSDYRLHNTLAPAVVELVSRAVRAWQFEPILVDGQAVVAKTQMHLRLHAEPTGEQDGYKLRVMDVHFGAPQRSRGMKAPHYPEEAVHHGVGAKVLLAIRLDNDGAVLDAQVYQSSLDVRASSEQEAEHYRHLFEQSSLSAARQWHYDLAEKVDGRPVGSIVMVPIAYFLKGAGTREVRTGEWKPYLPGPVHQIAWLGKEQVADSQGLSSLKDGEAMALDSRFRLKEPVAGKLL